MREADGYLRNAPSTQGLISRLKGFEVPSTRDTALESEESKGGE